MTDHVEDRQKEQWRRQAQRRREEKQIARAARKQAALIAATPDQARAALTEGLPDQAAVAVSDETPQPPSMPATDDPRGQQWRGSCKFALNRLRHNRDELEELRLKLCEGRCELATDDPQMLLAATELVLGLEGAGVRPWDWSPVPTAIELVDAAGWAERRLVARLAEQNGSDRARRRQHQLDRALGKAPLVATGTINPVHLQRSTHSLDELRRRLEWTIAKHQEKHGEFRREWLDPRNRRLYIADRDGGISNKQVTIMASMISGRQESRSFDDNWKIVTAWLKNTKVE